MNAGYAADGYARVNGVGAAVVTYGVGGFEHYINAAAGAFAEHVPMIVISGAPPSRRRESGTMVHHLVSSYYLQLEIFRKVTIDSAILTDPNVAPDEIDRVILNLRRPESCPSTWRSLPISSTPHAVHRWGCLPPASLSSDEDVLVECVSEGRGDDQIGPPILLCWLAWSCSA